MYILFVTAKGGGGGAEGPPSLRVGYHAIYHKPLQNTCAAVNTATLTKQVEVIVLCVARGTCCIITFPDSDRSNKLGLKTCRRVEQVWPQRGLNLSL